MAEPLGKILGVSAVKSRSGALESILIRGPAKGEAAVKWTFRGAGALGNLAAELRKPESPFRHRQLVMVGGGPYEFPGRLLFEELLRQGAKPLSTVWRSDKLVAMRLRHNITFSYRQ